MNLKYGWKTTALVLSSFAMALGFTACGSSDQSNAPLQESSGVVELVGSSLQYDAAGTTISGTITTNYPSALTGTASLSDFSSTVSGCSVTSTTVGTGDTVSYTDNNNVVSNVQITLSASCSATSVTLKATETDDANVTYTWSKTADVGAAPISGITSPIATIVADTASQNIELTQNNEPRQIILKVFDSNNVPVTSGTISVKYPDEVVNSVDVGTLNPVKEVAIQDGEAVFAYTGPSDLISLINSGHPNAVFTFFDTLNPTKSVDITIAYNPDTTMPPPVLTGYTVDFISSNQEATTNLETTSAFTLSVKDDKGNLVANEDVNSTDITSLQPNLVKFVDDAGDEVDTLHFDGKNNMSMTIKTYKTSGLVPFAIAMKIKDANGVLGDKNVTKAITVFSGPPTAMSISYSYTEQDKENAKFIDKMVVSLTDQWSNPVNTAPTIYAGAIVGYAENPLSTIGNHYMISNAYNPNTGATGNSTIGSDGADGAIMTDPVGTDFSEVDPYNDILMTFGLGRKYHASGKWDIASVAVGSITMTDKYASETPTDGMGYAIGYNYRQEICDNFGREWIGQVDSADGTYKVDPATGSAIIDFRYDYMLTGKTVIFGASTIGTLNSTGEVLRIGEAARHNLRGHGFDGGASCSIPAGSTMQCEASVHITDTGYFARNVNFGWVITGGEKITVNSVTTSMEDLYGCTNGGVAFVELSVTNSSGDADTIGISIDSDIVIGEF